MTDLACLVPRFGLYLARTGPYGGSNDNASGHAAN